MEQQHTRGRVRGRVTDLGAVCAENVLGRQIPRAARRTPWLPKYKGFQTVYCTFIRYDIVHFDGLIYVHGRNRCRIYGLPAQETYMAQPYRCREDAKSDVGNTMIQMSGRRQLSSYRERHLFVAKCVADSVESQEGSSGNGVEVNVLLRVSRALEHVEHPACTATQFSTDAVVLCARDHRLIRRAGKTYLCGPV